MSEIEEIKTSFAGKLDEARRKQASRLEGDLLVLRAALLREFRPILPADLDNRLARLGNPVQPRATGYSPPIHPQVDMTSSDQLRQMDEAFLQAFALEQYYPVNRMHYPTVYCETLEEFYAAIVALMDLSAEARQNELQQLVQQAEETARKHGGGVFGYNLPGKGAYLNGWLFAYNQGLSPREAFSHPKLLSRILETAAHEKLGHGFLAVYSALGQVKTSLGLTQVEIARKFGLRTADDPTSSLRREQANLLFLASQLLEEGWATWVETTLAASFLGSGHQPRYTPQKVMRAIQSLPSDLEGLEEIQKTLLGALALLLGDQDPPLEHLHQAVMVIEVIGGGLDEFIGPLLGQPLRYAVGELLLTQAERNLGTGCVPYAALIAANISFDPAAVGLNDLRDLLSRDPRLNPDTRLAALSRLRLAEEGNVATLAGQAEAALSFSVPREIKK